MSIGSTLAVEDGEDQYRTDAAKFIAEKAAQLVASGDMGPKQAIEAVTNFLRSQSQDDTTGIAPIENQLPSPSKSMPDNQVAAIQDKLMDAAQNAADTL